jgi:hypothetical protein
MTLVSVPNWRRASTSCSGTMSASARSVWLRESVPGFRPSCKAANTRRDPSPGCRRWVAEAARAASSASNRQGWHGLHQQKASGHGASTDSPAVHLSDYDATLRAAIERVVTSRTTIEIELTEMASDDQNRILIIPWTPPSPHRRREIIQGEGERPCAVGPSPANAA